MQYASVGSDNTNNMVFTKQEKRLGKTLTPSAFSAPRCAACGNSVVAVSANFFCPPPFVFILCGMGWNKIGKLDIDAVEYMLTIIVQILFIVVYVCMFMFMYVYNVGPEV